MVSRDKSMRQQFKVKLPTHAQYPCERLESGSRSRKTASDYGDDQVVQRPDGSRKNTNTSQHQQHQTLEVERKQNDHVGY